MKGIAERTGAWLEHADGMEASLVELVVAASECSEDLGEVCDLVDGLLATGKVVLRCPPEPPATIPPR